MLRVTFEPTIPVCERAKHLVTQDSVAAVIGHIPNLLLEERDTSNVNVCNNVIRNRLFFCKKIVRMPKEKTGRQ